MTNSKSNWRKLNTYRVAVWIGNYRLLPDIIGFFLYNCKIYKLPGGKNVWK